MKTIIIYTTKYGCTGKAAKLIQGKTAGETRLVNLSKEKAPDLSAYDTVVLGGSIYVGKTQKELTAFMQQNLETLKKKKLALYLCAGEQDPAKIEGLLAANFPAELLGQAIFRDSLGGELEMKNVGIFMRFMLKTFIGVKEDYSRLSEEKIGKLAKAISTV